MLQPEEVVEVFVGDTLEEAMAFAVAALGPDLSVRRARKVRKGVQGLVGRDKYEVLAVPAVVSRSDDAVGSAFDALLSLAEEQEQPLIPTTAAEVPAPRARRTTRPHPAPEVAVHVPFTEPVPVPFAEPVPAAAFMPEAAAPVSAPGPTPVSALVPALVPALDPAEVVVAAPVATRAPAKRAATKKAPVRKRPAPAPTGWSLASLEALGLPPAVLGALPADEPADDLSWVVALAVALSSVLPAPAALGDANPVVVNGYGLAGVLGLLDAAARGLTPGTITVGDRTAAATATELALAVRAAVVG